MGNILNNKKVCLLATSFLPQAGGAERFSDGLARHLFANKVEVVLLVPFSGNPSFFPYQIIKLKWLKIGNVLQPLMPLIIVLNLLITYQRFQFEILQVVGFYPGGYAAALFKKLRPSIKLIVRGTGADVQKNQTLKYGLGLNPNLEKKIEFTATSADYCVANSDSMQDDLKRLKGTKIAVIPNGLDLERFDKSKINRPLIGREITGNPSAKIILNVGRIEARKNQRLLIKAFSLFAQDFNDVFLVLVGKDDHSLDSMIEDYHLEKRVILLGELGYAHNEYGILPPQNLIDLYLASTLYAHPSLLEGQPNVILEALAAGLPVVGLKVPGTLNVIEDGITGLLVENEVKAYSQALVKLLKNQNLYAKMSKNALTAAQKYNWDKVVLEYERLYQNVLG